ncbi:MAG: Crp/Fnr family transcriptional regulator [Burkholderiaceae bacterium]|nr:Crp/Fnr family transcriptional regulator [Burkholderiaceae bacterium]
MLDTIREFDIPRFLARTPLFWSVSTPDLERLADGCQVRRFGRGELVLQMGEPCQAFHIVVSGQVKLYVLSTSGQEKVVDVIPPGGSFAEALMFLNRPSAVNAQALTDTLLVTVRRETVLEELRRDSSFALSMLAGMSLRLHGLVQDVQASALQSGVQRVIGYLLRDQEDDGVEGGVTVSLPVSKATVASLLSLTPEYFSRVLRELESARLIRVDKRDIHVLDIRRLAAYQA